MSSLKYVNEPLEHTTTFWSIRSGNSRMGVIAHGKDKICVVSPLSSVPAEAFSSYTVSHLLAPNHYHNKALSAYMKSFPAAQPCASKEAKPRLEDVTGQSFKPLTVLAGKLPENLEFLTPAGLKTGEIWIKIQVDRKCGWFVTDAFSGKKMSSKIYECDKPELLKTFPGYGVSDKQVYKKWVLAQIEKDKPTTIIPCHGSIIRNTRLPALLDTLVKTL